MNLNSALDPIKVTRPQLPIPLELTHNTPTISSLDYCKYANKQHKNVMRTIEGYFKEFTGEVNEPLSGPTFTLKTLDDDEYAQFIRENFIPSTYKDSIGRELPCYLLTEHGFAHLATGLDNRLRAKFIICFYEMQKYAAKLEALAFYPDQVYPYYVGDVRIPKFIFRKDLIHSALMNHPGLAA